MKTLVLNASYEFLGFTDYKGAICATVTGKVVVEEEYDWLVRSPSTEMKVPAVIRLKTFVRVAYDKIAKVSYTKTNLFIRDYYMCQYCGTKHRKEKLGIDHVFPKSKGGLSTWENTVTACKSCNHYKGDKLLEDIDDLKLIRQPYRPSGFKEIIRIKIGQIHVLWEKYL